MSTPVAIPARSPVDPAHPHDAPLGLPDDFGATAWAQRPCRSRIEVDSLAWGWQQFREALTLPTPYRDGSVRLSRAVDKHDDNRGELSLARDPEQARLAFLGGRSVTLNHLQRLLPADHPVMAVHRDLCRLAGAPAERVQVAAFHSAAGARAFGAHTDPNHVFVVQVEGSKNWEHGPQDAEVLDVLEPGDVLYLPHTWRHAVGAREVASLSLSFIVEAPTWQVVAHQAAHDRLAASAPDLVDPRRALPWGWLEETLRGRPPRPPEAPGSGLDPVEMERVVRAGARSTAPGVPAADALGHIGVADDVGATTVLRRGWDGDLFVAGREGLAEVSALGRRPLRVPVPVAQALLSLPAGVDTSVAALHLPRPAGPADSADAPDASDAAGGPARLDDLARALVAHGYLSPTR